MVDEAAHYEDTSFAALLAGAQGEIPRDDSPDSGTLFSGNTTAEAPVWKVNGSKPQSTLLVEEQDKLARFEQSIMPHMNAAYNLARWLSRNDSDAQDIVQEAYLRAFKFLSGFRGGNSRAWLLRIVRNAFYDWLKKNRGEETSEPFDEQIHDPADEAQRPDALLLEKVEHELLDEAIASLPLEFKEVLVLRELEGFSYREISEVANIPLGTVMSRLARGRDQLRAQLIGRLERENK
jgi:RNA polymerase sigma factor (sigma-70 family)